MIKFSMALAMAASFAEAALPSCLYCKKMDEGATYLTSYSYCRQSGECLADAWNYIDRPCQTGWKRGKSLTLQSCEATEETNRVPSFTSSKDKAGVIDRKVFRLDSGEYATIKIDAK